MKKKWMLFIMSVLTAALAAGCTGKKAEETPAADEKQEENKAEKKNSDEGTEDPADKSGTDGKEDVSGDYKGSVTCEDFPPEGSYTVYQDGNPYDCVVVYVEKEGDCNIRFRFAEAVMSENGDIKETDLLEEHIAHYTENGYFEYQDETYHLCFCYKNENDGEDPEMQIPANHVLEIYGVKSVYDLTKYGEVLEQNGLEGNLFRYNVPFAG